MIWLPILIMTLLAALYLAAPLKASRRFVAAGFIGFTALALGTYALIGSPGLTQAGALQAYHPPARSGPSQADIKAAQAMSAEDRAQMIMGMVDGLAAKLEETPDNPQGWARLLTARRVLGQDAQAEADIARIKEIYKTRPELAAQILNAAKPN